jgi:hypothetical protein
MTPLKALCTTVTSILYTPVLSARHAPSCMCESMSPSASERIIICNARPGRPDSVPPCFVFRICHVLNHCITTRNAFVRIVNVRLGDPMRPTASLAPHHCSRVLSHTPALIVSPCTLFALGGQFSHHHIVSAPP